MVHQFSFLPILFSYLNPCIAGHSTYALVLAMQGCRTHHLLCPFVSVSTVLAEVSACKLDECNSDILSCAVSALCAALLLFKTPVSVRVIIPSAPEATSARTPHCVTSTISLNSYSPFNQVSLIFNQFYLIDFGLSSAVSTRQAMIYWRRSDS